MDNSLNSTEEQSISMLEFQNWRNKNEKGLSAFSQDEVTGTELTLLPETTKIPRQTCKIMIFISLDIRQQGQ